MPVDDEQAADVGERQAGEPSVLLARPEHGRGCSNRGLDGIACKLGEAGTAGGARGRDDERDRGIDGDPAGWVNTVLVHDHRRPRHREQRPVLRRRQAHIDRQDRRTRISRRTKDRHPRPAGSQYDGDEVTRAKPSTRRGGRHCASVPRPPGPTPADYHRACLRMRLQAHSFDISLRWMHIVDWAATGEWEDIRYETSGGIAKLTINRPEVRNAFRPTTLFELQRAFELARDDPEIGAIILTGAGNDAFCSGGDQRIRGDDGYRDPAGIGRLNVLDLQVQIRRLPKPVVAMVAGYAIGGGHVLHLVCDLTIAADNARFGQTGPKVGSFDAGYGSGLLARTIGLKRAKEIWFLCEQYDAATAERWGLVNRVVPLDRLEEETVAVCRRMLEMSPLALRLIKAGFNADSDGLAGVQQLAGDATLLFYMSEEAQEGRNAYVEKRKPDFAKFPRRP